VLAETAFDDSNIVHWTDFEAGGHFVALETPDLRDVRAFFSGLPA
jgi:hypothetical protein